MAASRPTLLYQISISHFCEKARWALDFKGIPYRSVNLLPVAHILATRRLAPSTTVPILVHDGNILQNSPVILDYLEKKFPEPALLPAEADSARQAREWEAYVGKEIGPHLRRYLYFHLLDSRHMPKLLLDQISGPAAGLFRLAFPAVKRLMKKGMKLDPASAEKSLARLEKALEKLEREVDKKEFLVGEAFSRADLSAAALLAPMFLPPEHEYPWPRLESLPKPLRAFLEKWKDSAVEDWVLQLYQRYRRPKR